MKKTDAIALLGGSYADAARTVGVTLQAIDNWPDELPPRIADRVYGALWRQIHGEGVERAWTVKRSVVRRARGSRGSGSRVPSDVVV